MSTIMITGTGMFHADGTAHSHASAYKPAHAHSHQHPHVHDDGWCIPTHHPRRRAPTQPRIGQGHVEAADGAMHYGHGPAGAHARACRSRAWCRSSVTSCRRTTVMRRKTVPVRRARDLRAEPRFQPRFGQDHPAGRTIETLKSRLPISVVEGDQQTSHDAERIRATGARRCRSTPARAAISMRRWSARRCGKLAPADDSVILHRERRQPCLPGGLRPR